MKKNNKNWYGYNKSWCKDVPFVLGNNNAKMMYVSIKVEGLKEEMDIYMIWLFDTYKIPL